jgi:hypothetical protein
MKSKALRVEAGKKLELMKQFIEGEFNPQRIDCFYHEDDLCRFVVQGGRNKTWKKLIFSHASAEYIGLQVCISSTTSLTLNLNNPPSMIILDSIIRRFFKLEHRDYEQGFFEITGYRAGEAYRSDGRFFVC